MWLIWDARTLAHDTRDGVRDMRRQRGELKDGAERAAWGIGHGCLDSTRLDDDDNNMGQNRRQAESNRASLASCHTSTTMILPTANSQCYY